jgi:hypothetical protein
MKRLIVVGIAVLMIAMLAIPTASASPRQGFYLEKLCPRVDNPNACDIVTSDPFTQLVGGQIVYTDHVLWENPAGHFFEIARVLITTGDGSGSAEGQVRWLGDYGLITIMQGTGSLAGLQANARVEFKDVAADGRLLFSLTGTYHMDP